MPFPVSWVKDQVEQTVLDLINSRFNYQQQQQRPASQANNNNNNLNKARRESAPSPATTTTAVNSNGRNAHTIPHNNRERSLNLKNGQQLDLSSGAGNNNSAPSTPSSVSPPALGLDKKVRPRSFWANWWRF